jgi:hypothetical protein
MIDHSGTESLSKAFIHCRLPCEEWTHEAHLSVGLWHCLQYSPSEALNLLRERIKRYNVACGGVNTASQGYHETLTQLYLNLILSFLAEADRTIPMDALAESLIQAYGDRSLPLQYYSQERLFSEEARRQWVEPDLTPLYHFWKPNSS